MPWRMEVLTAESYEAATEMVRQRRRNAETLRTIGPRIFIHVRLTQAEIAEGDMTGIRE